ncbi:MAG: 50S ribosome-binding GTPase [Nitrospirae bacterium]|nr:50S ribosome-binding GTPase [Nitrospirota bacterium]
MPTNLPPEYFDAERRFRQATTPQEKIGALEELISTVPKHKGTDRLRADLRRKLSQLREEAIRKKKSGKGDLYAVERQGAAQVALVGFPNVGKSSVLKTLTNANPVIADYPMSTVVPLAGMMPCEDIQFQLLDLPPIGNESTDGWVSAILRNANVLLLVIDLSEDPDVQTELLTDRLSEWKVSLLKTGETAGPDEAFISKPVVIAGNKLDLPEAPAGLEALRQRYGSLYPVVGISTRRKEGIEELRRAVFENSRIIRVYSKQPGKEPEMKAPFTLSAGSTVLDLAELIHKDFVQNLKYASIWGSAKFEGQRVQRDYILRDRDIVEFHLK